MIHSPSTDNLPDNALLIQLREAIKLPTSMQRDKLRAIKQDAIKSNNNVVAAYAAQALGFSYDNHETQDFTKAVEEYSVAIMYFPDWFNARFNRGVANIHSQRFAAAVLDFNYAEKILIKDLDLQLNDDLLAMGRLLLFRGEARAGIGEENQLLLARIDIARSQSFFMLAKESPDSLFWIKQIPTRITDTFPNADLISSDGISKIIWNLDNNPKIEACRIITSKTATFYFGVIVAATIMVFSFAALRAKFIDDQHRKRMRHNVIEVLPHEAN